MAYVSLILQCRAAKVIGFQYICRHSKIKNKKERNENLSRYGRSRFYWREFH